MIFAEDIISAVSLTEATELARLAEGKVVLELGSQTGRSTVAIASTAALVHSVDWHHGDGHAGHGDTLAEFMANLDRYAVRDKVVVHVGRFTEVLPALRDGFFDVAFIDAFHEQAAVTEDGRRVLPLLKRPAALAFHDYGRFTVAPAVEELAIELGLMIRAVGESLAVLDL